MPMHNPIEPLATAGYACSVHNKSSLALCTKTQKHIPTYGKERSTRPCPTRSSDKHTTIRNEIDSRRESNNTPETRRQIERRTTRHADRQTCGQAHLSIKQEKLISLSFRLPGELDGTELHGRYGEDQFVHRPTLPRALSTHAAQVGEERIQR